jgi:hypothetical protein
MKFFNMVMSASCALRFFTGGVGRCRPEAAKAPASFEHFLSSSSLSPTSKECPNVKTSDENIEQLAPAGTPAAARPLTLAVGRKVSTFSMVLIAEAAIEAAMDIYETPHVSNTLPDSNHCWLCNEGALRTSKATASSSSSIASASADSASAPRTAGAFQCQ